MTTKIIHAPDQTNILCEGCNGECEKCENANAIEKEQCIVCSDWCGKDEMSEADNVCLECAVDWENESGMLL